MSTPAAPTGDAGPGPDSSDPSIGQAPTGTGDQTPAPETAPAPEAAPATEDATATIARLQNELAKARQEAGKVRVTAKERAADEARQSLAAQLMAVLDPDGAAEKSATPEQLMEQLTAQKAAAREAEMRLAVFHAAAAVGADPGALDDSVSFRQALTDINPTDAEAVKAAITAAIEGNPRLAVAPAGPPRGGAEFNAPPQQAVTAEQFAAMSYAQRAALFESDPDTYRRLAG